MAITLFFILLVYVTGIEYVGFYIVTPFYLYFTMWVLGQKNKKVMIISSIVTTVGIFLFFDLLLEMEIPMGRILPMLLG
jgi:hypothetical protein